MTPGARYFLDQRKAQGLVGVTDSQAAALAALMVPVRVSRPSGDARPVPTSLVGTGRGTFDKDAA